MSYASLIFQDVSFTYDTLSDPLLDALTLHFSAGWTGIVGANGVGKTTILKLAAGILTPQTGRITGSDQAIYCSQKTERAPAALQAFMASEDREARLIKDRFSLGMDWPGRWPTLSQGERKRAQIALALWRRPRILALDEPTNHLDIEARRLLAEALGEYRGLGLLVSHDRRLMDALCGHCLFIKPPRAIMRPGNYSQGLRQEAMEEEYHRKDLALAKKEYKRLKREATKRREAAARSDRNVSKRGLKKKDRDAREKIDRARVTGKDASAGRKQRQLSGRLGQAQDRLRHIEVHKKNRLGIWLPGARSKRDRLFHLPAGAVSLDLDREICFPDLTMEPSDRIGLTGPNGCGKTTMIGLIRGALNLDDRHVTYVPQEIDSVLAGEIMGHASRLSHDILGRMMNVISRLGSHPQRLLETSEPSPGEIRKLLLAVGIARTPYLIIMDEPTNHLDLPSIECLESALADCPCGLLLVSHDERFLSRLVVKHWQIQRESRNSTGYILTEH